MDSFLKQSIKSSLRDSNPRVRTFYELLFGPLYWSVVYDHVNGRVDSPKTAAGVWEWREMARRKKKRVYNFHLLIILVWFLSTVTRILVRSSYVSV